ncbi:MAG TPA: methyltransferase domain-containing protein [Phycisphaerales bacterium]|nr:methyltransferase domain-containing protein [Phycisphaerales bacterium]
MDSPAQSSGSLPLPARDARPVRIHQPPLAVRAMRRTARIMDQVRALLGLQRTISINGVRYIETGSESLRRALSRRGGGSKEYIAEFSDGHRMLIHCTHRRVFADLMDARLMPCYEMLLPYLRPGMRVLDFGCSTGFGAAWLLDAVGPSGAVVAIDRDRQSIEFAQRRYAAPNAAFEEGWINALSGETDGAFDLVVALDAFQNDDEPVAALKELWRVLKPGGWMLIVTPAPLGPGHTRPIDAPRAFEPKELSALVRGVCEAQVRAQADEAGEPAAIRWDEGSVDPSKPQPPATPPAPPAPEGRAEQISPASTPDHAGVLISKPAR